MIKIISKRDDKPFLPEDWREKNSIPDTAIVRVSEGIEPKEDNKDKAKRRRF